MEAILGYVLIFFARILDVSLGTIRMLMVVQGRRVHAAIIGFFEVLIFVLALGKVVSGLGDLGNLMAYSLGFASGNYIGMYLEEKMALGNLTAQVILNENISDTVETLREQGFGVTVIKGQGRKGIRNILNITLMRKDLNDLKDMLHELHNDAFITVSSTRHIKGGYFTKIKKK